MEFEPHYHQLLPILMVRSIEYALRAYPVRISWHGIDELVRGIKIEVRRIDFFGNGAKSAVCISSSVMKICQQTREELKEHLFLDAKFFIGQLYSRKEIEQLCSRNDIKNSKGLPESIPDSMFGWD